MKAPLWHYTCDHGRALITDTLITTAKQIGKPCNGPGDLVWMTDLASPAREPLGLTSNILSCDRTLHRFRVIDARQVVPWVKVRGAYRWAVELEWAPGARPMHWYVSGVDVPVVYDPIRVTA